VSVVAVSNFDSVVGLGVYSVEAPSQKKTKKKRARLSAESDAISSRPVIRLPTTNSNQEAGD
jgi:hypothetical protein